MSPNGPVLVWFITMAAIICFIGISQRAIAEVEWRETRKRNVYRVGHKGKVMTMHSHDSLVDSLVSCPSLLM